MVSPIKSQHGPLLRTCSDNVALGNGRRSLSPKTSTSDLFELVAAEGGALSKFVFVKVSSHHRTRNVLVIQHHVLHTSTLYISLFTLIITTILFYYADKPGSVYKVRKFPPEFTVDQAIADINATVVEEFKSERNRLYFNGAQLEGGKLISSYGFQVTVCFPHTFSTHSHIHPHFPK